MKTAIKITDNQRKALRGALWNLLMQEASNGPINSWERSAGVCRGAICMAREMDAQLPGEYWLD